MEERTRGCLGTSASGGGVAAPSVGAAKVATRSRMVMTMTRLCVEIAWQRGDHTLHNSGPRPLTSSGGPQGPSASQPNRRSAEAGRHEHKHTPPATIATPHPPPSAKLTAALRAAAASLASRSRPPAPARPAAPARPFSRPVCRKCHVSPRVSHDLPPRPRSNQAQHRCRHCSISTRRSRAATQSLDQPAEAVAALGQACCDRAGQTDRQTGRRAGRAAHPAPRR